ncbi:hypothetical protein [Micromonospora sp. NPDC048839]|uniref:hypothetical protein n=2 Tax=Micromonospora TaxID=1873 RepID=UPI00340457CD
MNHTSPRPRSDDARQQDAEPFVIMEGMQFRLAVGAALAHGPARVDRILFTTDGPALLTVVGDDGAVYQLTYDNDRARTWVIAVQAPGEVRRPVRGAACDEVGFRLAGGHPHLVYELLARAHHPTTIVRGTLADFPAQGPR